MTKYDLNPIDILRILTGMLKAQLIATGQYNELVFNPGPLSGDLLLSSDRLGIKASGIREISKQACTMFDCPNKLYPDQKLSNWVNYIYDHWKSLSYKRLVFCTSGTTGEPQPNFHFYKFLEQEIDSQLESLPKAERIISFVFPQHIYGFLFTILLPKALNCPIIAYPPFATFNILQNLDSKDLVIGFPLFWKKLLEVGENFPNGIQGTTSTAPCPASTIRELVTRGFKQVIEIYGSSETGGIGTRNDPEMPYTLLSCWRKAVLEQSEELVRIDPDTGKERLFTAPDELIWKDNTYFYPKARKDSAIQVAGINVYPEKIRRIILKHPDILECAIRPMTKDKGDGLKAFIVLKYQNHAQEELVRKEIRAWIKKYLTAAEIPRKVDFGNELPQNAMGKIKNW